MSKTTRRARAAKAPIGSVAANHRIVINSSVSSSTIYEGDAPEGDEVFLAPSDLFTAEELATMPLVVKQSVRGRALVWRSSNGDWWRQGAYLRVQKRVGGDGHEFRIIVYKGANEADLQDLLNVVQKLRLGDGYQDRKLWARIDADWAGERDIKLRFGHRKYADPWTAKDESPAVLVCDEPRCREKWHTRDYPYHLLDEVRRQPRTGIDYWACVAKDVKDTGRGWYLEVSVAEFEGSIEDMGALVSDLQWMQEECRRANQANVDTITMTGDAADEASAQSLAETSA